MAFLADGAVDRLGAFGYVSLHAPAKELPDDRASFVDLVEALPGSVRSVVMHPDTLGDPAPFRRLGSRLVLENMDPQKRDGQTAEQLARTFAELPEAAFCLDVAHAWAIDPSLGLAHELVDIHGRRLRQLHVSGIERDGTHRPTTRADLAAYEPVLDRCRHVPWILESALVD